MATLLDIYSRYKTQNLPDFGRMDTDIALEEAKPQKSLLDIYSESRLQKPEESEFSLGRTLGQVGAGFISSAALGAPEIILKAAGQEEFLETIQPKDRVESFARGIGEFAGFVGGAPLKLGAKLAGKITSKIIGRSFENLLAKGLIDATGKLTAKGAIGHEALTLGLASALSGNEQLVKVMEDPSVDTLTEFAGNKILSAGLGSLTGAQFSFLRENLNSFATRAAANLIISNGLKVTMHGGIPNWEEIAFGSLLDIWFSRTGRKPTKAEADKIEEIAKASVPDIKVEAEKIIPNLDIAPRPEAEVEKQFEDIFPEQRGEFAERQAAEAPLRDIFPEEFGLPPGPPVAPEPPAAPGTIPFEPTPRTPIAPTERLPIAGPEVRPEADVTAERAFEGIFPEEAGGVDREKATAGELADIFGEEAGFGRRPRELPPPTELGLVPPAPVLPTAPTGKVSREQVMQLMKPDPSGDYTATLDHFLLDPTGQRALGGEAAVDLTGQFYQIGQSGYVDTAPLLDKFALTLDYSKKLRSGTGATVKERDIFRKKLLDTYIRRRSEANPELKAELEKGRDIVLELAHKNDSATWEKPEVRTAAPVTMESKGTYVEPTPVKGARTKKVTRKARTLEDIDKDIAARFNELKSINAVMTPEKALEDPIYAGLVKERNITSAAEFAEAGKKERAAIEEPVVTEPTEKKPEAEGSRTLKLVTGLEKKTKIDTTFPTVAHKDLYNLHRIPGNKMEAKLTELATKLGISEGEVYKVSADYRKVVDGLLKKAREENRLKLTIPEGLRKEDFAAAFDGGMSPAFKVFGEKYNGLLVKAKKAAEKGWSTRDFKDQLTEAEAKVFKNEKVDPTMFYKEVRNTFARDVMKVSQEEAVPKFEEFERKPVSKIIGELPKDRLFVATKTEDGTVFVGKKGDTHGDVYEKHNLFDLEDALAFEDGFITPEGKFLNRSEATEYSKKIDKVKPKDIFGDAELESQAYEREIYLKEKQRAEQKGIVGHIPEEGLVTALKYEDGKIYVGKPGEAHYQVADKYELNFDRVTSDGFVSPEGKFLSRKEALKYANKVEGLNIAATKATGLESKAYNLVKEAEAKGKVSQSEYKQNFRETATPEDKRQADVLVAQTDALAKKTYGAKGQERSYLGIGISNELRETGQISLIGKEIGKNHDGTLQGKKDASVRDMALLANEHFRNNKFEEFRLVLTKSSLFAGEKDTIVYHTMVTNRLPGHGVIVPHNKESFAVWLNDLKQSGIDFNGFYVVHNHPRGRPEPSGYDNRGVPIPDGRGNYQLDASVTNHLINRFSTDGRFTFRGHIVINSNKYAVIGPNNRAKLYDIDPSKKPYEDDPLFTPAINHPMLGKKIESPGDLVDIYKNSVRNPDQNSVVISVGTRNLSIDREMIYTTKGIMEVANSIIDKDPRYGIALLRRFGISKTGTDIGQYLVTKGHIIEKHKDKFEWLIDEGFLTDVVDVDTGKRLTPRLDPSVRRGKYTYGKDKSALGGGKERVVRQDEKEIDTEQKLDDLSLELLKSETTKFPATSEHDKQSAAMSEMGMSRLEIERSLRDVGVKAEEKDIYNSLPTEQQMNIAKGELPKNFGEQNKLVTKEDFNKTIVELRKTKVCK